MNNLKRILSLALASVMVLGMMVVGASAKEFTDGDTIANTDAVDTLVALNVIGGFDDGSFQPEGNVTRAQMAKMIAVALNGGNEEFRGSSSGSQFKDVPDGKWYVKFVNYCVSKGIINGRSDTIFDPEANVTATEAAVMVMRAMGYRNETFLNEKGVYSPAAVDAMAEDIGLYDDTTKLDDTGKALNRQNAAQVIYNGIQLPTPEYTMSYNSEGVRTWTLKLNDGQLTGKSIMAKAYGAKVEFAILTKATYNPTTKKFTYTFDNSTIETAEGKLANNGADLAATATDYSDLYMQKVRVVYIGKDIQGISAVGKNILGSGVTAPYAANGKLDGITNDGATSSNFNGVAGTPKAWWTYDLIDNDGDSKIEAIVYHPITVATVSAANATQVAFSTSGVSPVALKDNKVDSGLKRGDLVAITTTAAGVTTVKKLDVVENVTATNLDKYGTYTIGGEDYDLSGWDTAPSALALGKTYDLTVLNGYIFAAVDTATGSAAAGLNDLIYAIEVGPVTDGKTEVGGTDTTNKTQLVRFIYANGTATAVKTVASLGVKGGSGTDKNDPKALVTTSNQVEEGKFYTYTENKNGTYALMPVSVTANNTDFANLTCNNVTTNDIEKGIMNGIRFNDDAVVIAKNTYTPTGGSATAQYKVFTGKEINEWQKLTGKTATLWTTTVSGFKYAVVGAIDLGSNAKDAWPGAAANGDHFGYVVATADRAYVTSLQGTYTRLQIWTGTETVTRYLKESSLGNYPAGTILRYKEASDGTITLVATDDESTPWTAKSVAVTAYAGGNTIQFAGATNAGDYTLENAAIIYVDGVKKADAAAISLANPVDFSNPAYGYYNNVKLIEGTTASGAPAVLALFVDVNNKLGAASVAGNTKTLLSNVVKAVAAKNGELTGATAITLGTGDIITNDEGVALYTQGIFEAHIEDTTSDKWSFYTVTVKNETEASVTYKLVRTNGTNTVVARQPEFTLAAGESATLTMICGNKIDSKFEVKTGETVVFTLTWEAPDAE